MQQEKIAKVAKFNHSLRKDSTKHFKKTIVL